jgi:hypothetical protein
MDEPRVEVGTRERTFEVSQLRRSLECVVHGSALQSLSTGQRSLEGAAVCFHLCCGCVALSLTSSSERSARLRIVGKLLPLGAPGGYRVSQLRARSFRYLAGNAILISGDKVVALSNANRLACARIGVSGGRAGGRWAACISRRYRLSVCIR